MRDVSPSTETQDLKKLAEFLDSKFRLPGGFRIGWDGILGFIPGIGDLVTNLISFYIIVRAAMIGCSPSVILHMGLNVLLDNLFDMIPILGNIFDIIWKSNTRNMALVEKFQLDPASTRRSSRWAVFLALSTVAIMLMVSVALVIAAVIWVWQFIASASI